MGTLNQEIIVKLQEVYDPEISINIYDLGLIYHIGIDEENNVSIEMTLTSPGCPVAPLIEKMVKFSVSKIPEVKSVGVEFVFDPPWGEEHMSDEVRLELGMF